MNPEVSQSQFEQNYGHLGIKPSQPFDLNPSGLKGLTLNRTDDFTNVNVFASGRYTEVLTVGNSGDQRIVITAVELTTSNDTIGANTIAILNKANVIIWTAGDAQFNAVQHIQPETDISALQAVSVVSSATNLVDLEVDNPASTGVALNVLNGGTGIGIKVETASGTPIQLNQDTVLASHFKAVISFNSDTNFIITSDGTTPNGVVTANQGDLCLNASGTGQLARCAGGSVWNLI